MVYGMEKEAEDFMCDQVIFATDVDFTPKKRSKNTVPTKKLNVAIEIIANSWLPTITNVYYAYLRNQKFVVENVRKIIIPTMLAMVANYLSQSLSSVQRRILPARLELHAIVETSNEPEKSVECNVLTCPKEIKVDVIFVHGLHGAQDKTWKQGVWLNERHKINRQVLTKSPSLGDVKQKGSLKRSIKNKDPYVVLNKICKKSMKHSINESLFEDDHTMHEADSHTPFWPIWLEKDCPGARVITVNYSTDPYLWRPIWIKKRNRTGLVERSAEMVEQLWKIGVGKHPIVWVGHSKGGLYIKQMLLKCSTDLEAGSIIEQSKAILFYSVPHRGSIMADMTLPLLSKSVELTEVQRNCKFVLELHDNFLKLFDKDCFKPNVFSFIETSFTLMSFIYLKIVSFESADPGIGEICGVPLDHREICKPAGRDCFLYKELVQMIQSSYSREQSVDNIC